MQIEFKMMYILNNEQNISHDSSQLGLENNRHYDLPYNMLCK